MIITVRYDRPVSLASLDPTLLDHLHEVSSAHTADGPRWINVYNPLNVNPHMLIIPIRFTSIKITFHTNEP